MAKRLENPLGAQSSLLRQLKPPLVSHRLLLARQELQQNPAIQLPKMG